MVLDEFPRQLARTRRFTLGVPRAVTISADGQRVLFLRTSGGEDPVSRLWLLDLADNDDNNRRQQTATTATAATAASGCSPTRPLPGTSGRAKSPRPSGSAANEPASWRPASSPTRPTRTAGRWRSRSTASSGCWASRLQVSRPALPRLVPTARAGDGAAHRPDRAASGLRHRRGAARRRARHRRQPGARPARAATRSPTASPNTSRPSPCTGTGASGGRRTAVSCWPRGSTTHRSSSGGSRTPPTREQAPRAIRYPAAGTANAEVTAHVLRLDGTRTELNWDRKAFEYLTAASWDAHGPLLSVQSRDQRTVLILAADPATGADDRAARGARPGLGGTHLRRAAADQGRPPGATSPTWTTLDDWSSTRPR